MNLLSALFGSPLPSVNAADLIEKLKNGKRSLVVDVRQPEEYTDGHIAVSYTHLDVYKRQGHPRAHRLHRWG